MSVVVVPYDVIKLLPAGLFFFNMHGILTPLVTGSGCAGSQQGCLLLADSVHN